MRTVVDLRLVDEAAAQGLRFRCDDCGHFDERADDGRGRCAHGYPTDEHRPPALAPGVVVTFCKEFELGATDAGTGACSGGEAP